MDSEESPGSACSMTTKIAIRCCVIRRVVPLIWGWGTFFLLNESALGDGH